MEEKERREKTTEVSYVAVVAKSTSDLICQCREKRIAKVDVLHICVVVWISLCLLACFLYGCRS